MWKILTAQEFCSKKIERENFFIKNKELKKKVADIIENVYLQGDKALYKYTKEFDNTVISQIRVDKKHIAESVKLLKPEQEYIFEKAISNIRKFHSQTIPRSWFTK